MAALFPSLTSTWHHNTYPSLFPSRPELSAKGKTVIVTRGGTGIGAKTADVEIFVASTDVTDRSQVDTAFSKFVGNGEINVLVNNAATVGPLDHVKDVDGDKFLEAIHANIKGSFNVAKAFLRHAASNAVVINVSSSLAHLNFSPGFASYPFHTQMAPFVDALESGALRSLELQLWVRSPEINEAPPAK
ncbi:hypothetical protein ACEPPN_000878 [Leptodophora sp. 'Broadleaf-Isolate-01']